VTVSFLIFGALERFLTRVIDY